MESNRIKMDLSDFKKYLKSRNLENNQIIDACLIIQSFNDFLLKKGISIEESNSKVFFEFSKELIDRKENIVTNYIYLYRYGVFIDNKDMFISALEAFDGGEVITNLYDRLLQEIGADIQEEIFSGVELPVLGIDPKEKPKIIKELITRLLARIDRDKCVNFLADGLRDKYTDSYKEDRNLFLESDNFNAFLSTRRERFIDSLKRCYKEELPFFNQEITEDVIEYIENNPLIHTGVREDNILKISKIPYMTKQFLETDDDQLRKYYYCHCPWAREALKRKSKEIDLVDPIFCNCSAGYLKNYWEAVLDQPIKVEVLTSILNGDSECSFQFEIPSNVKLS